MLARALVLALLGAPLLVGSAVEEEEEHDPQTGGVVAPPVEDSAAAASVDARRQAVDKGLAFLARAQAENQDGSFPRGKATEWAPIGVASLGALAFMAGGNSPGRGPYGRETELVVEYLLAHADLAEGSKQLGYISNQGDQLSRMHGHGFATLALTQAYGMAPRNPRLERALAAAVDVIERSQSPEGGWHYAPRPVNHEGSVTICLVQALRAAHNAGIHVDRGVIARAEDYVLALKNEAGLFRYQLDRQDASISLTAAAITTLNMAGRYDGAVIRESVDAIWSGLELRRQSGNQSKFPHYERLYLAQAFWQLSDPTDFERWYAEETPRVLRTQRTDGSWSSRYGASYATAVNVLVLALPDGLLPIFQR
ncbi:MAG: prenyltransferase/squalene oxidase repeat-containing protein [Planctomycetota bacterium]